MTFRAIQSNPAQGSKLRVALQANASRFWDFLPKFLVNKVQKLASYGKHIL